MSSRWTEEELEALARVETYEDFARLYPHRSYDSARKAARRHLNKALPRGIDDLIYRKEAAYYRKKYEESLVLDKLFEQLANKLNIAEERKLDLVPYIPNHTACLLISDSHVGETIKRDATGGISEYNTEIFEEIISKLEMRVAGILTFYNIKILHVYFLGDIISGIIHQDIMETNEVDVAEAISIAAHSFSQFLMGLSQIPTVERINVTCIAGNHGRILNTKPYYKNFHVNWDYFTYKTMELLCRSRENILFNIPKAFLTVVEVGKQRHLLMHGEDVPIRSNRNSLYKLIQNYYPINLVCIGHHHFSLETHELGVPLLVNGSIIPINEFALKRLYAKQNPTQVMFGVGRDTEITWKYNITID